MHRRDCLQVLRDAQPVILPSLLLCDFANLEREVRDLEAAGIRALHLDVMDGVFVPNLTYGMPLVAALRRVTDLPLDVHLMITRPERYIDDFFDAGADVVTLHIEATEAVGEALHRIRQRGAAAGLALNPATDLDRVIPYLDACDLLLVMSVDAGFGGQSFNPVALEKLARLRSLVGPDVILEVDGGVNGNTVAECVEAGADWLVAGSAIFNQPDYRTAVETLMGKIPMKS